MKQLVFCFLFASAIHLSAQDQKVTIFNPDANAAADISTAIVSASSEGKHVLIQVGGNWCPWCIKLHKFIHENQAIDSVLKADYVFILVNNSKENKNAEIMKQYEFPQRFGFPVLLVLDDKGRHIHTQDTGLLEEGGGYSENKIKQFLRAWNKAALDPANYK